MGARLFMAVGVLARLIHCKVMDMVFDGADAKSLPAEYRYELFDDRGLAVAGPGNEGNNGGRHGINQGARTGGALLKYACGGEKRSGLPRHHY